MKKKKKIIATLLITALLSQSAKANIDNLLDNIVSSSYYAPPGEVKSPTTTTYTLGSYSFRIRNDLLNRPVLSIRPPSATISCSGADFDAGMLSLLNLSTFGDMLSQAGSSVAWGIVIGLVYSLPGIGDAFQKLNEWSRMFQSLLSNSCAIGIQVGRSLGQSLFENAKEGAQGQGVASGTFSSFESAYKNFVSLIRQTGQIRNLFGTMPYGALFEAGWNDKETADLIASLFGVIEWRAVDSSGNDCTSESCLQDGSNIKVSYYPPKITNLQDIVNGGNLELYSCNWTYDANIGTFKCQGGITTTQKTLTKGLRQKIADRIDTIVDNILSGTYKTQINTADAYWIKTVPVPNFPEILNYLAILKKQNLNSQYQTALYGISEFISSMMLKALVDNAYNSLSMLGRYFTNKDTPTELITAMQKYSDVKAQVDNYLQNTMQTNYFTITTAAETYKSLKDTIQKSFAQKFGQASLLFMR